MTKRLIPALILSAASLIGGNTFADVQSMSIGAESEVRGPIQEINQHTRNVFRDLGLSITGSSIQKSGAKLTLEGKKGDMDVQVQMSQVAQNETHVDVIAKEGTFKWNKDYAKKVLSEIIQQG
jgi:hypothetical protein